MSALFISILVLQVLDAATTYWAIKLGAYEANPVMVWLAKQTRQFSSSPWAWLVIAKLGAAALLWQLINGPVWAQAVVVALYLAVVVNNVAVIERLQRRAP